MHQLYFVLNLRKNQWYSLNVTIDAEGVTAGPVSSLDARQIANQMLQIDVAGDKMVIRSFSPM